MAVTPDLTPLRSAIVKCYGTCPSASCTPGNELTNDHYRQGFEDAEMIAKIAGVIAAVDGKRRRIRI